MIIYQNLHNWEVLLPSQDNAAIKATETGERATQIVSYLLTDVALPNTLSECYITKRTIAKSFLFENGTEAWVSVKFVSQWTDAKNNYYILVLLHIKDTLFWAPYCWL